MKSGKHNKLIKYDETNILLIKQCEFRTQQQQQTYNKLINTTICNWMVVVVVLVIVFTVALNEYLKGNV